jgi:DNA-binding CsgD family transcriptional regulator
LGGDDTRRGPAGDGPVEPVQVANLFYGGRTTEARELVRRARPSLPLQTLDDVIALSLGSRIALETGEEWPELDEWMTATLTDAVRIGDHAAAGQAAYTLACLRQCAGRYLEALALLAEAQVQFDQHDPVGLAVVISAMQLELASVRDGADDQSIAEAERRFTDRLGDTEPLAHQLPYVRRAQAWAIHAHGDLAGAQRLLIDAASELSLSPVHGARMSYEAMRAGAPARKIAAELNKQRGRCDARLVALYADHAAARGSDDGAALVQVVEAFTELGAVRYAAEASAHAADAFARHGREDSARRAAVRVRELHALGSGAPVPTMTELDNAAVSLTARERQLTQLAAQGLSNVEMAERLVLSVRTVESHLYRAMQKLGVTDRRDLRR